MLAAGVLALLMSVQLAFPGMQFLDADRFNQFLTMHGSAMIFLFAVLLFEAMAILILSAFLGARDMPFPRLSAFGYWSFLIGGLRAGIGPVRRGAQIGLVHVSAAVDRGSGCRFRYLAAGTFVH